MTVETFKKYWSREQVSKEELFEARRAIQKKLSVCSDDRKPHLEARLKVLQEILGEEVKRETVKKGSK